MPRDEDNLMNFISTFFTTSNPGKKLVIFFNKLPANRPHEHARGGDSAPVPLLPQDLPEPQQQDGTREEEPSGAIHQGEYV